MDEYVKYFFDILYNFLFINRLKNYFNILLMGTL